MNETTAVLITLVVYNAILIGVGLWARSRNKGVEDFFLAGRGLGPWVAAISASASSSSAWTLLGVSGAAYAWGLPALWIFPATVGGFLLNWAWVAPRLQTLARRENAITLSAIIAPREMGGMRQTILRVAAVIIVFCFTFYIASQFEAAGKAFESVFGLSKQTSILIGAGIVLLYTLLGGFWAVSVTDSVQGILMVVAAIVLPVVTLHAVGGFSAMFDGLATTGSAGSPPESGVLAGVSSIFFVLGLFGIGIGYPGQPHVVNRFMALKDRQSLRQGRVIAMAWAVLVYAGMLLLGLGARVMFLILVIQNRCFSRLRVNYCRRLSPASCSRPCYPRSCPQRTANCWSRRLPSPTIGIWPMSSRSPDWVVTRTTVVAVLILATVSCAGLASRHIVQGAVCLVRRGFGIWPDSDNAAAGPFREGDATFGAMLTALP